METFRADSNLPYVQQQICSEHFCNRPAIVIAGLTRSKAKPYCRKHYTPVRNKLRTIDRLDRLLNKILLLNVKSLGAWRTIGSTELASGTLVLYQVAFDRPLTLYLTPVSPVDPRSREIAYCFDSCVHALETLAGVLAYFTEGSSMQVEEINIKGVKASQLVLVLELDEDVHGATTIRAVSLAQTHSMFKVSLPSLGEVYLDPTAPQYGRPQGWRECSGYLQAYHDVTPRVRSIIGSIHYPFGHAYSTHRDQLNASGNSRPDDPLNRVADQTAIRYINNIVHLLVENAGGPQVLRTADDKTWHKVEEAISYRVGDYMESLRADMDQINFGVRDADRRSDAHWSMLAQSQGAGNIALTASLSRVHGAALRS